MIFRKVADRAAALGFADVTAKDASAPRGRADDRE
jgi:hypothetical protein